MTTTDALADDKFHDECGVFGIYGDSDGAAHAALGLHALQHRGQEAAGIVTFDGKQFHAHRDVGQVGDIFGRPSVMERLAGHMAIGHTRYSTTGESALRNVQPLFADLDLGGFALAHNGNLTNARQLRQGLVKQGSIFQSTSDTEVVIHLTATARSGSLIDRLISGLRQIQGAYSLVAMTESCVIGLRDPLGVRPLVLGRVGDALIVTSETCALDIIGAQFIREGTSIYQARKRIGRELSHESHVPADVVVPVPDSGVPAAIGYAEKSQLPFELGIIRNHYVGRTFIEPGQQIRHLGVKLKHNANPGVLAGRRVVLVDDSIVRGTTSVKIVELVRSAGATEVHLRIAAPPTAYPCFYGINTPSQEELLASQMDVAQMAQHIGVDSLAFISTDGLYRAMGEKNRSDEHPQYCDACFTGDYPIPLTDREGGDTAVQLSLLTELA
jgi:amidophosphoribosyltransferase